MPEILTTRARTSQPRQNTPLDQRFQRPLFLYVPSLGSFDLTNTTRKGTKGASDNAWATLNDRVTYQTADATNAGLDFGTLQAVSAGVCTVIVLARASVPCGRNGMEPLRRSGRWISSSTPTPRLPRMRVGLLSPPMMADF